MSGESDSARVVIVTGGASGIGASVAEAFADLGDIVIVVDIDVDAAQQQADRIVAAGGRGVALACDVSDEAQVETTTQAVVDQFGRIDVLICNAGMTAPAMISKMTTESWRKVLGVNLDAAFYWLRAVAREMTSAGRGRIIFTVSSTALNGSVGQAHYAAAKSGVLGLMRSAARELGRHGILVNAVAPSAATNMTAKVREDERFADIRNAAALPRWADPDEVAGTYVFLAGPQSTFMTGQLLSVDGGHLLVR